MAPLQKLDAISLDPMTWNGLLHYKCSP